MPWLYEASRYVYNDGLVKTAYTDLTDIGRFVARIVADPRTLNHHVRYSFSLSVCCYMCSC